MKKITLICFFILLPFCFIHTAEANTKPQKLIVLLDWFANPNHAPLFVAQQQGFFTEAGLAVELIGPSDPSYPPKLVAAGKADIAITYQPQFIEQVHAKLPLIAIGSLINQPLNCLVVLEKNAITSITDLKGKRIGYSDTGMNNMMLKTMLNKKGLDLKDVQLINVHYDLTQALLSKKVDAVTGLMRNFEILQLALLGYRTHVFYPEDYGIPSYSELIFVVRQHDDHDSRFPLFLAAVKKGVLYLKLHPEETWRKFAKLHPELNNELNHRAWLATLPYFADSPQSFNPNAWLRFLQFMQKNGLIEKIEPLHTYFLQ